MGNLKPGATYIHERDGKVVYAREFGASPDTRQVVGWDYDPKNPNFDPRLNPGFETWRKNFANEYLWNNIMLAAEDNLALQEALERVKILYHLSKENGETS
jgi:hypothetical protein